MSHFTVMVIGDNPEQQLSKFDETLETPRYIEATKEQLIKKERESIEDYRVSVYEKFMADPEAYKKECRNDAHIKYLENDFPKKLSWSDEEVYQESIIYYDAEDIGENGEVYSTRNPNSKWDWYVLGGRWSGLIKLKKGAKTGLVGKSGAFGNNVGIDQAIKKDIQNFDELCTFAVVKDGEWYERGEMGWWGVVHDEKDESRWDEEFKKLVTTLPDDILISIYDCHI